MSVTHPHTLYEVSLEVDAAGHAPPYYTAATVTSAVWAASAAQAISAVKEDLVRSGYCVQARDPSATALDVSGWDDYLHATWPAQVGRVPTQAEMEAVRLRGDIIQLAFFPHG